MDLIKDMIKQFYSLLILLSCMWFVLWIFFSGGIYVGDGIFELSGRVYESLLKLDELKNDGLNYVGTFAIEELLIVEYTLGPQNVGGSVAFKDMFKVKNKNGSVISGSIEEFALYLLDIRNEAGNSVLEVLTTEEIETLEEIPAAFIYDRTEDILYFHSSGIYMVSIKIYGMNGEQKIYEFRLPVEAS